MQASTTSIMSLDGDTLWDRTSVCTDAANQPISDNASNISSSSSPSREIDDQISGDQVHDLRGVGGWVSGSTVSDPPEQIDEGKRHQDKTLSASY
jgi:hypothetical protein